MDIIISNTHEDPINDLLIFDMEVRNLQNAPSDTRHRIQTVEGSLPLVTVRIVNYLRRILIGRIPTWCIDLVEIIDNSTQLYDDLLVKRLGLIPLIIEGDVTDEELAGVTLSLDVTPQNPAGITQVYSTSVQSSHPSVRMYPNIEIIRITRDQKLKFQARIKKGIGRDHTKYCPVATVAFEPLTDDDNGKYQFKVKMNGGLTSEEIINKALEILAADLPVNVTIQ